MTNLELVVRLTLAYLWQRPMRMVLTVFATIAAACVVIWVVSGYDALIKQFDEFADVYLGRYEFVVVPYTPGQEGSGTAALNNRTNDPPVRFVAKLVDELRADPAVATVDTILQVRARMSKAGAEDKRGGGRRGAEGRDASASPNREHRGRGERPGETTQIGGMPGARGTGTAAQGGGGRGRRGAMPPMLVGTSATEAPYPVLEGRWIDPLKFEVNEAAISSVYAQQLNVKLGDEVQVQNPDGEGSRQLKIVGIIEQRKVLPPPPANPGTHPRRGAPLPRGPAAEAVYVPLPLAENVAGLSGLYDLLGIVLKPGYKPEEFQRNWDGRLEGQSPMARLQSMQGIEAELNDSVGSETLRGQAYMATGISLLASLFIIFSTLNMGVDERVRQFAMLRAVACTTRQVAAMIVTESLLLGLVGWGGGLLAGWGLLVTLTSLRPELFPQGVTIGFWSVALSGLCAVGGALLAAILPTWKATRVSPLEAMASSSSAPTTRIPWGTTFVGLCLVSLNPLLVFIIPMPDDARYMASVALGCTSMGIGFILLAPVTILVTDRLLTPIVCRLFGTAPRLLASQLSTNLWRSLGTTIALSLGLGLFISMQTWGYSMLGPFVPGDWVPDIVVMLTPTGIPDSEVAAVRSIKGVEASRSLPCIVEQAKFATDVTGANIRATTSRQDNCVLAGVDPDLSLGGGGMKPVFDFPYVRGTREEALAKLKQGRYCLVPDAFERETGLTVGDKFGVIPPNHPEQVVEYEIAAVVRMVGWHWMSKVGMRIRDGGRSAAMMIVAFDQLRKDMDVQRVNSFWINTDGSATEEQIKSALEDIAERNHDPALAQKGRRRAAGGYQGEAAGGGMGRGDQPRPGYSTTVALRSREGTRQAIRERAEGVIWLMSRLPLITLFVTSLGVVNTIIASIRARQWDMGVLRAVGITRFNLFRMILCESVLIGIGACLLSLGFGIVAGYCGTGISRYMNMRGGQITPLVVPWVNISLGCALTLAICLAAALWPAFLAGRAEPLRLLQAGRSNV